MRSAVLVFALIPLVALAAPKRRAVHPDGPPPPPDEQTRAHMDGMLATMRLLQPYLANAEAFAAKSNEEAVQNLLNALARDANGLGHLETMRGPGMKLSAEVLVDHVLRTALTYRAGRREQARWMLNTTFNGCISCHSQLPAASVRPLVDPATLTGTPMEQADLLFATRQFDTAVERYLALVTTSAADTPALRRDMETALRRVLAIDLRVRRSTAAAKADLAKALEEPRLPEDQRRLIAAWNGALARPELTVPFDPAKVKPTVLATWTRKVLAGIPAQPAALASPEQAVPLLLASGVLYEFLSRNPAGEEVSGPLLDLSRCDRALGGSYFFSLADLYLQTCVRRAAKTPLARRCYDELQSSVEFQFTGSRGTDVPDDLRKLLADLKALTK